MRQPEPVEHYIIHISHGIGCRIVRRYAYGNVVESGVSRRQLRDVSAENKPRQHRRSGRPGRGYLKFTNDTGTPCRISGWPSVTGLTATGQATPLRHLQSSMFGAWHYTAPPAVITLKSEIPPTRWSPPTISQPEATLPAPHHTCTSG